MVLAEASHAGKVNTHPELIPVKQNAASSMVEVVQSNQPSTRQMTDHPGEWSPMRDSVLASAASRIGTQQCSMQVHAAELM